MAGETTANASVTRVAKAKAAQGASAACERMTYVSFARRSESVSESTGMQRVSAGCLRAGWTDNGSTESKASLLSP